MKISVINGSPKGKYSITLQTINYLIKKYPDHEFNIIHAGQNIRSLEKDFYKVKSIMEDADAIIFSYPVYTFLAPSQLHRFIEVVKENKVNLKDKYATQITTSKHFYDVTAHKYIEENAIDLNMRYIRGLSADMEDLLKDQGRKDAEMFFDFFLWSASKNIYVNTNQKERTSPIPATLPEKAKMKSKQKDVVIITDNTNSDSNLAVMIKRFENIFSYNTRLINISEYPFDGGCLGCFRCAVNGKCVYKDGFDKFLREDIQKADAIVYAFTVSDHSMGSRFKMYDDRNFCNGHRTVTVGMPVGYIVSGNLSAENNLKTVIEARCETGGNFLAGIANDEYNTDGQIDALAKSLEYAIETKHTSPQNFYGIGGMKIFRDLIYEMRGMMRADHKFYKKRGIYDFPQKKRFSSLKMYLVGWMLGSEKMLLKMGNAMNEGMLAPYKKLIDTMDKNKTKNK